MKVLRKQEIETANIQVGDQVIIPLAEIGEFSATAHKVTDEGIMFIFDEYITRRPMNSKNTNKGGFEKSELKKWMDTVLLMAFPEELRDKIYGLTLPTVGQIVGHEDEWDNNNLESDTDEQLPLMKERKNRVAYFKNDSSWGWLRNTTKEEVSSASFAYVGNDGYTNSSLASNSFGVRPEFWLVKQESRGPVPRESKVSYRNYCGGRNSKEVTKESLQEEVFEKENEIKLLKQEIKNLEEKEAMEQAARETKKVMDSYIQAGFTKDEAFQMVMELSKTILGGGIMKKELSKSFLLLKTSIKKHSPEILTGIGIAGMITTTVMAVRATPKALILIEERKEEIGVNQLEAVDLIKTTWMCYVPAALTGTLSIACLIGASSVNVRRNAALATAYTLSESALKDYQEKVIEMFGEKKNEAVKDAIAKDKVEKNPVVTREVIITEKGNTLCYDAVSGRYFKGDIEKIKKAECELNRQMRDEMYISLNDFYYEIGLDNIKLGDELGWNIDDGYIDLSFSSQLASDGTPCLVIDYTIAPRYDFRNLR